MSDQNALPPAAVLFDAYGTLFDLDPLRRLAQDALPETADPGAGDALAALWRTLQIDQSRLRTLADRYEDFSVVTAEALDAAVIRLGLRIDPSARAGLLDAYRALPAFEDARATLDGLKRLGLRLAILSNGVETDVRVAARAAGLEDRFEAILSADAVRRFKTAPEVYAYGADALGLPAGRIIFVSANDWDLAGAGWFGFAAYRLNRAGRPWDGLGPRPGPEGRSLADLLTHLEGATGRRAE
jgi:2-haloacid dehalogenase